MTNWTKEGNNLRLRTGDGKLIAAISKLTSIMGRPWSARKISPVYEARNFRTLAEAKAWIEGTL